MKSKIEEDSTPSISNYWSNLGQRKFDKSDTSNYFFQYFYISSLFWV